MKNFSENNIKKKFYLGDSTQNSNIRFRLRMMCGLKWMGCFFPFSVGFRSDNTGNVVKRTPSGPLRNPSIKLIGRLMRRAMG